MNLPVLSGVARRRGALAASLLAIPLALTACGGTDDESSSTGSDSLTQVTVGVIPIVDVAPLYLGIDQGFFEDQGLELELELAQGGAAIVPGVMSDQYQFGFSNTSSLILAASQGLAIKGVAPGVSTTGQDGDDFGGVVVASGSDIKGAADLEGKKVAVNTLNNINTVTINETVRAAGGDPTTIEYVELPFPDIAAAVASGDVDAGQLVEPFLTIATADGQTQVASNYVATDPELMVGMYFTSEQYAADNADVVEKFSAAMQESLAYAADNPDATRAILSEYSELEPAVQEKVVLPSWPTEVPSASVDRLAELMVQDGVIDSAPDTSALLP
jgi:NitT/TauT family transport system substrate-binding protein